MKKFESFVSPRKKGYEWRWVKGLEVNPEGFFTISLILLRWKVIWPQTSSICNEAKHSKNCQFLWSNSHKYTCCFCGKCMKIDQIHDFYVQVHEKCVAVGVDLTFSSVHPNSKGIQYNHMQNSEFYEILTIC